MYEELKQLVNTGNWEKAYQTLIHYDTETVNEELSILASMTYLNLGICEDAFTFIQKGLEINNKNYELYLLLGNYYETKNVNQAWLCYENAEFFCDNPTDLEIILQFKRNMELQPEWNVKPTAVVIISYNKLEMIQQCIESIRIHNLPSSYEMIVVDNASEANVIQWLNEQSDIKLLCNQKNMDLICNIMQIPEQNFCH